MSPLSGHHGVHNADSVSYVSGGVKGTPAFGFKYWNDPGAFANGFRGVATVFVFCSTFYSGVESIAVAGE